MMTRNDFLASLRAGLAGHVPARKISRLCHDYDEMISDLMADGRSEADAVAAMGSVGEVVYAATATPIHQPATGRRIVFWALIILGSPLWGSLLLAAGAVGLAVELCLWMIPLTSGILAGSFVLGGGASALVSPVAFIHAPFLGLTELGVGLGLIGAGVALGAITYQLCRIGIRIHRWGFALLATQFTQRKAVLG
ncbi:DUF1700 domain-containing protein [Lacticaseibacillus sp. GG6-2]